MHNYGEQGCSEILRAGAHPDMHLKRRQGAYSKQPSVQVTRGHSVFLLTVTWSLVVILRRSTVKRSRSGKRKYKMYSLKGERALEYVILESSPAFMEIKSLKKRLMLNGIKGVRPRPAKLLKVETELKGGLSNEGNHQLKKMMQM